MRATLIAAAVTALGFTLWIPIAMTGPIALPAWAAPSGDLLLAIAAPVPGLLAGAGLATLAWRGVGAIAQRPSPAVVLAILVSVVLGISLPFAVIAKEMSASAAALVALLAAITFLAGVHAFETVRGLDGVEFETHWGGVGGGLGGWRVSPAAVFLLLFLVFASATVAVVMFKPGDDGAAASGPPGEAQPPKAPENRTSSRAPGP